MCICPYEVLVQWYVFLSWTDQLQEERKAKRNRASKCSAANVSEYE